MATVVLLRQRTEGRFATMASSVLCNAGIGSTGRCASLYAIPHRPGRILAAFRPQPRSGWLFSASWQPSAPAQRQNHHISQGAPPKRFGQGVPTLNDWGRQTFKDLRRLGKHARRHRGKRCPNLFPPRALHPRATVPILKAHVVVTAAELTAPVAGESRSLAALRCSGAPARWAVPGAESTTRR